MGPLSPFRVQLACVVGYLAMLRSPFTKYYMVFSISEVAQIDPAADPSLAQAVTRRRSSIGQPADLFAAPNHPSECVRTRSGAAPPRLLLFHSPLLRRLFSLFCLCFLHRPC